MTALLIWSALRMKENNRSTIVIHHISVQETRMRIGVSVRLGWERRRQKLMQQEICYYEWKNLIAEASRRGLLGEEMLQWDSYELLSRQLEQEWLHSIEERKKTTQPKGNKRAPKSAEQRRKISEAISAKWADPEYRSRVCSGLYKFHGVKYGAERKPKRKPSDDMQTRKRIPPKTKDNGIDNLPSSEPKHQSQGIRLKKTKKPLYKDPLASSKLEMLKNIRAQRTAAENQSNEMVARAKFLIAEAEKAAKALEKSAKNLPLAQSSLLETQMLIVEAIQFVESIENGDPASHENSRNSLPTSTPSEEDTETRRVNHIEKKHKRS